MSDKTGVGEISRLKFIYGGINMSKRLIPADLVTLSNAGLMDALRRDVLQDIPTGIKIKEDLDKIEYLLGKLANDYLYVVSLQNYTRNYVRQLKRSGDKEAYENMMDKRDTLEAIASAIKLQHSAVSRMLTVLMQNEEKLNEIRLGEVK